MEQEKYPGFTEEEKIYFQEIEAGLEIHRQLKEIRQKDMAKLEKIATSFFYTAAVICLFMGAFFLFHTLNNIKHQPDLASVQSFYAFFFSFTGLFLAVIARTLAHWLVIVIYNLVDEFVY